MTIINIMPIFHMSKLRHKLRQKLSGFSKVKQWVVETGSNLSTCRSLASNHYTTLPFPGRPFRVWLWPMFPPQLLPLTTRSHGLTFLTAQSGEHAPLLTSTAAVTALIPFLPLQLFLPLYTLKARISHASCLAYHRILLTVPTMSFSLPHSDVWLIFL